MVKIVTACVLCETFKLCVGRHPFRGGAKTWVDSIWGGASHCIPPGPIMAAFQPKTRDSDYFTSKPQVTSLVQHDALGLVDLHVLAQLSCTLPLNIHAHVDVILYQFAL